MEGKFKVGDKVRMSNSVPYHRLFCEATINSIHIVYYVDGDGDVWVRGGEFCLPARHCILIPEGNLSETLYGN